VPQAIEKEVDYPGYAGMKLRFPTKPKHHLHQSFAEHIKVYHQHAFLGVAAVPQNRRLSCDYRTGSGFMLEVLIQPLSICEVERSND
jgi:hypothetical protein